MIEPRTGEPTEEDWAGALLTSGTEALLGAVRNYIGPVRTPYDKRDLVAKLRAFLRRAETRQGILELVDGLDARVLGSSLLLGPSPEQDLKELFTGELPLFELGVRISNLVDRLLLFRYQAGSRRLIAVNPLVAAELRQRTLTSPAFLASSSEAPLRLGQGLSAEGAIDALSAVALFSLLLHSPPSIRKGGSLTKKAAERAAALLPALAAAAGERLSLLGRALSASGALPQSGEDERRPDPAAFSSTLAAWGEDLPYYLASCLCAGSGDARTRALVIAASLEALPPLWAVPRSALARWMRIAARRSGRAAEAGDPAMAIPTLEAFGLLAPSGPCLSPVLPRRAGVQSSGGETRRLVAEGSHALHLMPEASLEERLYVGSIARPVLAGTAWTFEIDRATARRAFAAGLTAQGVESRLEDLAQVALPQSLTFSLASWEEEYRSLRLYRGFVLAADERQAGLIELSPAYASLVAERLGKGLYLLAADGPEEAAQALAEAGLEAPPLTTARASGSDGVESSGSLAARGPLDESGEGGAGAARERIDALREYVGRGAFSAMEAQPPAQLLAPLDPEPRLARLREALATSKRDANSRRELAERIERRLVLTEAQIESSDPRSERLEAGGLDYLGKVRVVETSLRSPGDRLEILYRLPGEEPVRAVLRPVRLDKNEKGLVLEAEDLATGGPARVPLGAVSTVRRLRSSLFGEER